MVDKNLKIALGFTVSITLIWPGTPDTGALTPCPFNRGVTGAEVLFRNSTIGNLMFYHDRLETNLLQLFAHPDNS